MEEVLALMARERQSPEVRKDGAAFGVEEWLRRTISLLPLPRDQRDVRDAAFGLVRDTWAQIRAERFP